MSKPVTAIYLVTQDDDTVKAYVHALQDPPLHLLLLHDEVGGGKPPDSTFAAPTSVGDALATLSSELTGIPRVVPYTETLASGTEATAYEQTLLAASGTPPYTYAVTAGSLPTGITLAADGTLSGTPTVADIYSFTVTATDAVGRVGVRELSIDVVP